MGAIEDGEYKAQKKTFWNDVYGVDMSVMTPTVMKEPLVDYVNRDMIVSTTQKLLDLDLTKCKKSDVNFASSYKLIMNYSDTIHGMVVWFDTPFSNLTRPVTLSTSPYQRGTHWKQTVFYCEKDMQVKKGDILEGSFACRQSKDNFRELDIKISYHIDTSSCKHDYYNLYKLK